mgnify:CR=1 FL=1
MINFAKTPGFVPQLFSNYCWNIPNQDRKVFLTFDDGPIPNMTPWVLETLNKYNAKASFFCIGDNVKNHPEIYKSIIENGHTVCNHTYSHMNGWKNTKADYLENVDMCSKFINSKLFRPPYGQIRNSQGKALIEKGYKIIMWDVLSWDFSKKVSPDMCLKNVTHNIKAGSIVVFHDNLKAERNLKFALPKCLKFLSDNNYVCASLNKETCS